MAVADGRFQLYSRIDPPLKAGTYRFTTRQRVSGTGPHGALAPEALPVEDLQTHVRVRSPQYLMPPDQVLSTFPPAGREGAFGSRLPQVVVKRRTLPWERTVDDAHPDEPWLALVVVAEGEAEIALNQPVAACVTPGVRLDTPADAEKGAYLAARQSVVHRVFPTQEEVGLLAHAREVDIDDTELMMGDDDGFLAVVIANRLPLAARAADGTETPVTYLACLVNLCGQFDRLLDKAPATIDVTLVPSTVEVRELSLSQLDRARMDVPEVAYDSPARLLGKGTGKGLGDEAGRTVASATRAASTGAPPYVGAAGWVSGTTERGVGDLYSQMAEPFRAALTDGFLVGDVITFDPEVRFPVLMHWSFTSTGDETFESIMAGLDSGLLGTTVRTTEGGGTVPVDRQGRPPFEVVETGHVGLEHRLRVGDEVRSWYRGPLVPHPTQDGPGGRLPLAHAADQVRTVVPDGREDISLAAAFEIGRLLGLSRPSTIAALLRWRQVGYQVAQRAGVFAGAGVTGGLARLGLEVQRDVGARIGALVAAAAVSRPADLLGDPSPLATAGRPVLVDHDAAAALGVLARGLGLDEQLLSGSPQVVLGRVRDLPVRLPDQQLPTSVGDLRGALVPRLDVEFSRAAVQALAPQIRDGRVDLDVTALTPDLRSQVETTVVPDVGVLRRRLDLEVDLARLPKGADPLDLLVHARPVPADPDHPDDDPRQAHR